MRIILIVSDTFRYDHLGAAGTPPHGWGRVITPRLHAFAHRVELVRGLLA